MLSMHPESSFVLGSLFLQSNAKICSFVRPFIQQFIKHSYVPDTVVNLEDITNDSQFLPSWSHILEEAGNC